MLLTNRLAGVEQLSYVMHSTKRGRSISVNKRMQGQREENRKGPRSLSLLMQIVAPQKEFSAVQWSGVRAQHGSVKSFSFFICLLLTHS